jgi:hypothetical protein
VKDGFIGSRAYFRPKNLKKARILRVLWPVVSGKVWTYTVIVQTFLRYYSMSDIFGLAYLVGQIED